MKNIERARQRREEEENKYRKPGMDDNDRSDQREIRGRQEEQYNNNHGRSWGRDEEYDRAKAKPGPGRQQHNRSYDEQHRSGYENDRNDDWRENSNKPKQRFDRKDEHHYGGNRPKEDYHSRSYDDIPTYHHNLPPRFQRENSRNYDSGHNDSQRSYDEEKQPFVEEVDRNEERK